MFSPQPESRRSTNPTNNERSKGCLNAIEGYVCSSLCACIATDEEPASGDSAQYLRIFCLLNTPRDARR